jgi:threonine synthase
MLWLYGGDLEAMRRDVIGVRYTDDEVRATIRQVYRESGYVLDPHSAIGYLGITRARNQAGQNGSGHGIFLATAHPAKFAEVVEPIIGAAIEKPAALAEAIASPRHIVRIAATFDALKAVL